MIFFAGGSQDDQFEEIVSSNDVSRCEMADELRSG